MYLTSTCQIKTDSGKNDRLILVIDENQCYLIINIDPFLIDLSMSLIIDDNR